MLIIHASTGDRRCDILSHKTKKLPRFRRVQFTGLTVRDATLEIVRVKFTGLPDVPGASEIYYPGEIGLFVYENLITYLKLSRSEPIKKESDREKYHSKL